jgi:hypothetical protein
MTSISPTSNCSPSFDFSKTMAQSMGTVLKKQFPEASPKEIAAAIKATEESMHAIQTSPAKAQEAYFLSILSTPEGRTFESRKNAREAQAKLNASLKLNTLA